MYNFGKSPIKFQCFGLFYILIPNKILFTKKERISAKTSEWPSVAVFADLADIPAFSVNSSEY